MISEEFLADTATVYKSFTQTADRKKTYSDAVTLSNIKVNAIKAIVNTDKGLSTADTVYFYFDKDVSLPSDFIPKEKMCFVFNDKEYMIKRVKESRIGEETYFYKCELA